MLVTYFFLFPTKLLSHDNFTPLDVKEVQKDSSNEVLPPTGKIGA